MLKIVKLLEDVLKLQGTFFADIEAGKSAEIAANYYSSTSKAAVLIRHGVERSWHD